VGTAQDTISAKDMFELAAAQRNTAAQKALGYCFTNGWGTAKNFAVAAEYFGKAAANGDKEAAEVQVACYKYGGEYLAVNEPKARYYADQYGLDYDNI
jgi:TPR repeat protein